MSREKWVHEGDRNTKFFHLTTMVRRRRNKIDGLFDVNGIWCDNHEVMKTVATLGSLFFPYSLMWTALWPSTFL
jgi:hypothetical protein